MPTEKRGLTVAITGASGYLGRRLTGALAEDDRIHRVVAFDVRPPDHLPPGVVFDTMDIRDPTLEARLTGVDVVVHLAFVMDPIKDETAMRDVNVNGSHNVFSCSGRAGVRKLVYTSSAVVYGAHADNDVPLTEDSPLRANLDFSYAAHKMEVEYLLKELTDELRGCSTVVFRPAPVLGPGADNAWSHVLELPFLLGVKGHAPAMQVVHEDDVARALHMAVVDDIQGVFNLACPGWLEGEEILSLLGRRKFDLPEPLAFTIAEKLWSLGWAEAPAGMLHYVMHPWVITTDKLAATGFVAERSNEETLREAVAAARAHVRLGRRRVRRGDLVASAAAGGGLIATALVARELRRRREKVNAR